MAFLSVDKHPQRKLILIWWTIILLSIVFNISKQQENLGWYLGMLTVLAITPGFFWTHLPKASLCLSRKSWL